MSIVDDLRSLDTNDPGRWPLPIRAGAVALVFAAAVAIGIWLMVIKAEMPRLERLRRASAAPPPLGGSPSSASTSATMRARSGATPRS